MNVRTFAAACLATALGTASAATAPDKPPAPESAAESAVQDRQIVDTYVQWAGRILTVPAAPDLDPALHAALAAMVDEHLARLRQLLPRWLADERQHAIGALSPAALRRAIDNRFVNEIALWRLESPGPDYDAVLTRAVLKPGLCNLPPTVSYLGTLAVIMAAVPAADRPTLLAGERQLLAHWGQARTGLPPRPTPSLEEDENALIARLRSGDALPEVPMPPALADAAFKGELASRGQAVTCALHQWGLAQALRHEAPGPALAAWRYATLITASKWSPAPAADAKAWDYPPAAARAGVTGTIQVVVSRDAQGRYLSGRVAERHVDVPGVRDNPPVAFETLFDSGSLAKAPREARLPPVTAPGTPPPFKMDLRWILQ